MKVQIKNLEKTKGMLFQKKLYGLETTVTFSHEEKAIIKERNLGSIIVLGRDLSADKDPHKEANKGIAFKLAKAAINRDWDANNPHLTVNKLLRGPDIHYYESLDQVKTTIDGIKEALSELKDIIEGNKDPAEDTSFEL